MVADKKKRDKPASSCPKQFSLHAAQPPGIFFSLLLLLLFERKYTIVYVRPRWSLLWHELIACSGRREQLQTSHGLTRCSHCVTELQPGRGTELRRHCSRPKEQHSEREFVVLFHPFHRVQWGIYASIQRHETFAHSILNVYIFTVLTDNPIWRGGVGELCLWHHKMFQRQSWCIFSVIWKHSVCVQQGYLRKLRMFGSCIHAADLR